MSSRRRIRPLRHPAPPLSLALALLAALTAGCTGPTPDRQAEVADRGAAVMPFDLDRTTHQFSKTDTGGVQTVIADDPQDTTQTDLIRQHLTEEVNRFRRGDFTDPGRIHGTQMPGLDTLRTHGGRLTITYEPTPDGARATYTTTDAALREALHRWFDAQVTDHGPHATG